MNRLKYIAVVVISLVGVSLSDGSAQARTLDEIMAEAIEAKNAADHERVVTLLQEAIALHPSPALINNLGSTYEKLGRYGEAVKAYAQVENDTNAPQELRNLDAARRAALTPKLGRIWLRAEFDRPGAQLRVDGELLDLEPNEEYSLDRGAHVFECSEPEGHILLRFERFPVSRRSSMPCVLFTSGPGDVSIDIKIDSGVETMSVNGYEVRTPFDRPRAVRFLGGEVALEFGFKDGTRRRLTTHPDAKGEAQLAQLLESSELVSAQALLESPAPPSTSSSYMPILTAAAGLVGVGVGAGLMALADSQRQEVADATVPAGEFALAPSDDGNQVQAYETQAQARENDDLGTAVLAVGASVAISGAIWWLLSDPEEATPTPPASRTSWRWGAGPSGLSLSARF